MLHAYCILPDHLHALIQLPRNDTRYSMRVRAFKTFFTQSYLKSGGTEVDGLRVRRKRNERGIWQQRFWEHTIRDTDDFNRHFDYIHYNPVKHDLVPDPALWEWSSFGRYVRKGWYDDTCGRVALDSLMNLGDWGE